jgi:diacylglycerol O-acyltransferase
MHVGIIACRESMPDIDDLVRRFPEELEKLKAAVASQEKATPIRRKKAAAPKS